ncbi:MAG TPA: sensor domain-containing diguanylate cyclase [Solirubrobacteraceae bacterium]|jgi:diguanylate cyclase (GGDEF)-like protein|nr:sensor domain-containing diguanylate cyclase [Solirubrobacteraceae bacterium]
MTAKSAGAIALGHARRSWAVLSASLTLLILLGSLAAAIVYSQQQSRAQLRANLALRATSSATLVSEFLKEQAAREQQVAHRFLSSRHVSPTRFELAVSAFGGTAAGLLNSSGRLIGVLPSDPALIGQPFAKRYRHFELAERGQIAISDVVKSAVQGVPVMAVAVPYATPEGRRVFSVAYRTTGSTLSAFVAHTIASRPHDVLLVDGAGKVLASSPKTSAMTLAESDPTLAHAVARSTHGAIASDRAPTTFATAAVPGTNWRLVVAVPNSHLYNSLNGWSSVIPWLVFALVTILGVLLVLLFARSIADRARLTTLSATMQRTAQTDALTGLDNRRALTEQLTRAAARARRHDEPLSVLMIDLDRFKRTNDTFGHEAGDQVLCTVADCMREVLRAGDIYGRWGGDEFLVALSLTNEQGAKATAERLRTAACDVKLDAIGLPEGIPLSIGVASGAHTSPIELVREADGALYEDKADRRSNGRGEQHGDALVPH